MRSDFLDTQSPNRLRAFYCYMDAALLAEKGSAEFKFEDASPEMRACLKGVIDAARQRAVTGAMDLFNGGEIKITPPCLN